MFEIEYLPEYFIVEKWRNFLKANPSAKERAGISFHSDVPPEFRYKAEIDENSLTLNFRYSFHNYPTIWRLVSKAYMQHLKDLIDERGFVAEEESMRKDLELGKSKDYLLKNLEKESRNIYSIRIDEKEFWSRVNQMKNGLPDIEERRRIIEHFHGILMPLISRDKPLASAFFVGELELFSKSFLHFRRGHYDFKMPEKSHYWIIHQEFEKFLKKLTNLTLYFPNVGNHIQFTFEAKGLLELPILSKDGLIKKEGGFSLKYKHKKFVFDERELEKKHITAGN